MQQAADAAVLGMPAPAQRTQQQYQQQQQQQQASLQPEQAPSEQQATYEDGLPMCVSITVDTTNGACQRACAAPEGCPAELKASCKCGDEAIDNLDKAAAALASEDAQQAKRTEIPALPSIDTTNYCPEMKEITADQLRCVFGMLDIG